MPYAHKHNIQYHIHDGRKQNSAEWSTAVSDSAKRGSVNIIDRQYRYPDQYDLQIYLCHMNGVLCRVHHLE